MRFKKLVNEQEDWRQKDSKYQQKTLGGVYFYSSPNSIYGNNIDPVMYNKLPKRMKEAVIYLENSKTMDGNHATINFVNSDGVIEYFDEYGLGDFYWGVKHINNTGKVSDWEFNPDNWKTDQHLVRKTNE